MGSVHQSEVDLPNPSVRGAQESVRRDFHINTLVGTLDGRRHQHPQQHVPLQQYGRNQIGCRTDGTARDGFEVNTDNILKVIEEHLNDV